MLPQPQTKPLSMSAELPSPQSPPTTSTAVLLEFLFRLGRAYLGCGEQTAKVESLLRATAAAYGMRKARVVAFPTAVFISLHDDKGERVTLAESPPQMLRLDQMAEVYALGEEAQRASIDPRRGLKRLAAIQRQKVRFGPIGHLVGHVILTLGLALILMPTPANLAAAAVLGFIVGLIKLLSPDRTLLSVPVPVIAAAVVSSLVFLAIRQGIPVDPLHALVPPLVTFLPGGMLTLGMLELAYGDMVSGASRLIAGFVQLILLAFGLAIGTIFTGYAAADLVYSAGSYGQFPWPPWIGVLVFGAGVYLHFSAPRHSFQWMMLVLLLAFAAQRIASGFFSNELSGFFGMLVATPLGYLIQYRFRGPPAVVTFFPAFWLLVPGALGLLSVTRMLSDRAAGIDGLITVVYVITSIALGTLVGASIYRWLAEGVGGLRARVRRRVGRG
jgi:uncharacterized membrane protein YjjP (DUF1212 family)